MIRQLPEFFAVESLAAGRNHDLLAEQIREFRPKRASWEGDASDALRAALSETGCSFATTEELALGCDVPLIATAGAAGLFPTLAALNAGMPVAIANKEVLVMAGNIVRKAMAAGGGRVRALRQHTRQVVPVPAAQVLRPAGVRVGGKRRHAVEHTRVAHVGAVAAGVEVKSR